MGAAVPVGAALWPRIPMTAKGFFVTGTDTGVGKTRVAVALVHWLRNQGLRVGVMKPVAAGVVAGDSRPPAYAKASAGRAGRDSNEDALDLIEATGRDWPYELVNPYLFERPIAPHLEAETAGVTIDIAKISDCYAQIAAQVDTMVVEGAGGFLVPTGPESDMADIAIALKLPVILVVGMRLGCLNHALLSAEAIVSRGLPMSGWIANCIDASMQEFERNLLTLEKRLPAPRLATMSWGTHDLKLEGSGWTDGAPNP